MVFSGSMRIFLYPYQYVLKKFKKIDLLNVLWFFESLITELKLEFIRYNLHLPGLLKTD